ncbi:hypothetical protein KXD40_009690 [Peronospora effusa]|nr:hypothetical protein KXD40_009690 [Peronospora effusa]
MDPSMALIAAINGFILARPLPLHNRKDLPSLCIGVVVIDKSKWEPTANWIALVLLYGVVRQQF